MARSADDHPGSQDVEMPVPAADRQPRLVQLTDRRAEFVDTELQSFGAGAKDVNYVVVMDDVPVSRLVRIDLTPL